MRLAFLWEGTGVTIQAETNTAAQIDRVIKDVFERLTGKRVEAESTETFLRRWVAQQAVNKKPKTAERYRKVVEDFLSFLGPRSGYDIRSVSKVEVQAFVNFDVAAGRSSTTVVLNAKILRAAFNAAKIDGKIENNPAGIQLDLPERVPVARMAFTSSEVEALLEKTRGTDWETAILLGAYGGMRLGDAVNLQWENVDFVANKIEFMPQKTSRKRKLAKAYIDRGTRLRAHLMKIAGDRPGAVCPSLAGREIGGRAGLSAQFMRDVMEPAGVDAAHTEERAGAGHRVARKSFHSLRHYFISSLANKGVSTGVIRELAGHADERQTERYTHYDDKLKAKAVAKIPGAKQ